MKYLKRFLKAILQFWKNIALFLGSVVLFFIFLLLILVRNASQLSTPEINQRVIYKGVPQKIAYVNFSGEIAYQTDDSLWGFSSNQIEPRRVGSVLRSIRGDKDVEAVVLEINSPGGSVVASEEVYQQIKQLAADKLVIAYMSETAASGGYYIALPAQKIMASVPTITGSIGVIMESPDLSGLFEKLGVKVQTYQSGEFKDIGSVNRAATEAEARIFKSIIDDAYQLFVKRIAEHRNLSEAEVKKLADGRIYTGKQAQANGLVDELGTLGEAFLLAQEISQVSDLSIVEYSYGTSFLSSVLGVHNLGVLPSSLLELRRGSRPGLHYLWLN